jgi:hypothetical protein
MTCGDMNIFQNLPFINILFAPYACGKGKYKNDKSYKLFEYKDIGVEFTEELDRTVLHPQFRLLRRVF